MKKDKKKSRKIRVTQSGTTKIVSAEELAKKVKQGVPVGGYNKLSKEDSKKITKDASAIDSKDRVYNFKANKKQKAINEAAKKKAAKKKTPSESLRAGIKTAKSVPYKPLVGAKSVPYKPLVGAKPAPYKPFLKAKTAKSKDAAIKKELNKKKKKK